MEHWRCKDDHRRRKGFRIIEYHEKTTSTVSLFVLNGEIRWDKLAGRHSAFPLTVTISSVAAKNVMIVTVNFVLNITVTKNLQFYEDYELLIDSLEKSMSEYSNIDFDEINVLFN